MNTSLTRSEKLKAWVGLVVLVLIIAAIVL